MTKYNQTLSTSTEHVSLTEDLTLFKGPSSSAANASSGLLPWCS